MRRGVVGGLKVRVRTILPAGVGAVFLFANYFTIRVTVSFLYKFAEVTRSFVGVAGKFGGVGRGDGFLLGAVGQAQKEGGNRVG